MEIESKTGGMRFESKTGGRRLRPLPTIAEARARPAKTNRNKPHDRQTIMTSVKERSIEYILQLHT